MNRRLTLGELRWPETPEFSAIAKGWQQNVSSILLGFVWQGYDLLLAEFLSKIDIYKGEVEIERSITQYLTHKIRKCMSGYEPFDIEQGVYEFETRLPAPAQPPLYDMAFALRENLRIMWPLEAKVLKTDGAIGEYIKEIKDNFLTCRYAPFSNEGAMVGYLLNGSASNVFNNITQKTSYALKHHQDFTKRDHKTSDHNRSVKNGKNYPNNFRCHHLIMSLVVHDILV